MKTVCFGEIMGRLTPPGYERIRQADSFGLCWGGSEANVAVSLAQFGDEAEFITKLPNNAMGDNAIRSLRARGVGVSGIRRGGERVGLYYYEKGISQRPSGIIYDRKLSAISQAEPDEFDWEKLLDGAGWFHYSGISPVLSDNCAEILKRVCKTARKLKLTVSCDMNYRRTLCNPGQMWSIMSELLNYTDILITGEDQCREIFGFEAPTLSELAGMISDKYGIGITVMSVRSGSGAERNRISDILFTGGEVYTSREYDVNITDRIGSGDAFAAGLIHKLQNGRDVKDALEFAVAAAALKHTVEGDFNDVTEDEINKLLAGASGGRVTR